MDIVDDRQRIVVENIHLVRSIAQRVYHRLPKAVDLDDLISAGVTGLIEAIERYDARRAVPFEIYAKHRIHGAVVDALRGQDWVPRSVRRKSDLIANTRAQLREGLGRTPTRDEMADAINVPLRKYDELVKDSEIRPLLSLDAPVGSDNPTPLVEQVDGGDDLIGRWQHGELKDLAVEALKHLPDRERTALSLYYIHELSLKEVGSVLGVTESRACQLCSQGLKRLRFRLREHLA